MDRKKDQEPVTAGPFRPRTERQSKQCHKFEGEPERREEGRGGKKDRV